MSRLCCCSSGLLARRPWVGRRHPDCGVADGMDKAFDFWVLVGEELLQTDDAVFLADITGDDGEYIPGKCSSFSPGRCALPLAFAGNGKNNIMPFSSNCRVIAAASERWLRNASDKGRCLGGRIVGRHE